jgi:hypothetical protein
MITLCVIGHIIAWKDETVFQKTIVTLQCLVLDSTYIIALCIW